MSRHALIVCNEQFKIEYFSKEAERLSGWKKDEVKGKDVKSILGLDDLLSGIPKEQVRLEDLLQKEEELFIENVFLVCSNEKLLEVGITIIPKMTTGSKISYFIIAMTDFKAQKEWERVKEGFVRGKSREIASELKTIEGFVEIHSGDIEEMIEKDRLRAIELEEAIDELEKRRRVQEKLLQKVLSAQEDERRHIVHSIHDDLLQPIIATQYGLQLIEESAQGDEKILKRTRSLLRLLDETVITTRTLLFDLRPAILDELGLKAAVNRFIELFKEETKAEVRADLDRLPELSKSKENIIYRIIQEALNNIKKHANAKNVKISSFSGDNKTVITIEDDGEGFDDKKLNEDLSSFQSYGIVGMRERAEMCSGYLEITSKPGKGTKVSLEIPI